MFHVRLTFMILFVMPCQHHYLCAIKTKANTLKIIGFNKHKQRSLETQKQYTDLRIARDESFRDKIKCTILIPEMYSCTLHLTMPFWIWQYHVFVHNIVSHYHVFLFIYLFIYVFFWIYMVMLCYYLCEQMNI